MKPTLWLAAGIAIGATAPALAQALSPMGSLTCLSSAGAWHSNCEKPLFDLDAKHGPGGVGDAQAEFGDYQSCLSREADNDARYAAQTIISGAKDETEEVRHDAAIWGFTLQ